MSTQLSASPHSSASQLTSVCWVRQEKWGFLGSVLYGFGSWTLITLLSPSPMGENVGLGCFSWPWTMLHSEGGDKGKVTPFSLPSSMHSVLNFSSNNSVLEAFFCWGMMVEMPIPSSCWHHSLFTSPWGFESLSRVLSFQLE